MTYVLLTNSFWVFFHIFRESDSNRKIILTPAKYKWCPDKIAGTIIAAVTIAADRMAGGQNGLRTQ